MVASALVLLLLLRKFNEDARSYTFDRYDSRPPGPQNITLDLSYLQGYDISSTFTYARRMITTKPFEGERSTLTKINETLFPDYRILEKGGLSAQEVTELAPLALQVPVFPKFDTSIMSFGIATSIPRLNDSIPQLSHWLSNTSSLLTVVAPSHNDTLDVELAMQNPPISINLNITTSSLPFVKAYFSLVKRLYDSRTANTQWLVLIDDDTFIPSLPYLISHLSNIYDSSKPQLVAAISDDFDQIRTWGMIPFGGGGIFISVPLAALLVAPGVWEKCMASSRNQGDGIFSDCVSIYTDVKPIFDHGLNQMDIMGSPNAGDGYFESGRRMLTVHHWKSWFDADIPLAAKVSEVVGDEGVFMRWCFAGGVVLSNGYSIVEYGEGIGDVDLSKVERTWDGTDGRWLHHIGPLRSKLKEDKKKSFRLIDAEMVEGGLRQIYLHKATEGEAGVDGVLELFWLK
ncbi:hypothetical protein D0Z07_1440 [Hyphodiscus hymeniophilus]|uniref:Glycosyltransferase family 31 protein n=1 Tax=Hyphodiscus hymeniophilus TaxID=353542 RepID=A0A9P6VR61_9HELO|nr:hypothetical protein D0Z07_1440 [Hyphodiscus hymeniophilus]